MKRLQDYNPIIIFLYYACVIGINLFVSNPILIMLSLLGSLFYFFSVNTKGNGKSNLYFFLFFLILAILNPLFSHNGKTVLFVLNQNPITLEATIYGVVSSLMIIAVLYWCRSFSILMTEDKLLYLFGKLSPKLALVLSMAIRYIPLYGRQTKKINDTQKALGLYKEDNAIDQIKGSLRVFSVLVTWALENGITTADSMTSRGYGTHRRTHFSLFRLTQNDVLFLMASLLLASISIVNMALGNYSVTFYPEIIFPKADALTIIGYITYGILSFAPTILEKEERIKWNYYESKI